MSTTASPEMDKKTSDGVDWEAWQTSFMNATFTNLRRFISIPFLAEKMERVRKGVTAREIVYEEDRLKVTTTSERPNPGSKRPFVSCSLW